MKICIACTGNAVSDNAGAQLDVDKINSKMNLVLDTLEFLSRKMTAHEGETDRSRPHRARSPLNTSRSPPRTRFSLATAEHSEGAHVRSALMRQREAGATGEAVKREAEAPQTTRTIRDMIPKLNLAAASPGALPGGPTRTRGEHAAISHLPHLEHAGSVFSAQRGMCVTERECVLCIVCVCVCSCVYVCALISAQAAEFAKGSPVASPKITPRGTVRLEAKSPAATTSQPPPYARSSPPASPTVTPRGIVRLQLEASSALLAMLPKGFSPSTQPSLQTHDGIQDLSGLSEADQALAAGMCVCVCVCVCAFVWINMHTYMPTNAHIHATHIQARFFGH